MPITYHIRIKKDYAASLIEDLQKMDAIELIDKEEDKTTPQWQIDEVNGRIKKYGRNPELLLNEEEVFKILD